MNDGEAIALALEEAKSAALRGEVPVGAVLLGADGALLARDPAREGRVLAAALAAARADDGTQHPFVLVAAGHDDAGTAGRACVRVRVDSDDGAGVLDLAEAVERAAGVLAPPDSPLAWLRKII